MIVQHSNSESSFGFTGGPVQAPTFVATFADPGDAASPDDPEAAGGPSYEFRFGGLKLAAGDRFDRAVDPAARTVQVALDAAAPSGYDLGIIRIDDAGATVFYHAGVTLDGGSTVTLDYGAWEQAGDLLIGTDRDGDGSIDDEEVLPDESWPDELLGALLQGELLQDELLPDEIDTDNPDHGAACDTGDPGCAIDENTVTPEPPDDLTGDTSADATNGDAPANDDPGAATPEVVSTDDQPAESDGTAGNGGDPGDAAP
jgi:hypothetical protein